MKRLCLWLCVWGCVLFADEPQGRPEVGEMDSWMTRLGAETFPERESAQKKLTRWADLYPRYLLTHLVERYRVEKDLEIQLRLQQLIEPLAMEHVFDIPPGFLGVLLNEVPLENGDPAIYLESVQAGHGAAKAELQREDLILSVDGKRIAEMGGQEGFMRGIAGRIPGTVVELLIQRGGQQFVKAVDIGPRPDDAQRAERHQQAQRAFRAWLASLATGAEEDPDFPQGHFPLD